MLLSLLLLLFGIKEEILLEGKENTITTRRVRHPQEKKQIKPEGHSNPFEHQPEKLLYPTTLLH